MADHLSYWLDVARGASIVLVETALFVMVLAFNPRGGLLRVRPVAPRRFICSPFAQAAVGSGSPPARGGATERSSIGQPDDRARKDRGTSRE